MLEKAKFHSEFEGYELTYYLTYTHNINGFGIGITSRKNGNLKSAECYNITTVEREALDFLSFLIKTSTFPTTLNNMVEDWLWDKCN